MRFASVVALSLATSLVVPAGVARADETPSAAAAEPAKVHVAAATASDVALHLQAGSILQACTAPCDLAMPLGTYRVGLSRDGSGVKAVHGPLIVSGPMTVFPRYESRLGYRIAGWSLLGVGIPGGCAMMVAGVTSGLSSGWSGSGNTAASDALAAAGVGVALGSLVVGIILASVEDKIDFTTGTF